MILHSGAEDNPMATASWAWMGDHWKSARYNLSNGSTFGGGWMKQLLVNGQIFNGEEILAKREVMLDDGLIAEVRLASRPFGDKAGEDLSIVDLGGGLLAPGFIDCQVNGGGVMFNDGPDVAAIKCIIQSHRAFGTTGLLPTLITTDAATMAAAAQAVATARGDHLPGLLGVHFEGPFLNSAKKGAHDDGQIRPWDDGVLDLLTRGDLGVVVLTLAPEVVPPGIIRRLSAAGIRVCAGHCAPDNGQIAAALDEGLAGFTHLFNAMPPLTSREPGIVGAALVDDATWCGIIVDGHHVDPTTLRIAVAAKAPGRMILVTDAMAGVGAGMGEDATSFQLSGQTVTVKDGRCTLPDGTLAGSNLDMAGAVRNAHHLLDLPLEEALRMASLYPAGFLGMDDVRGRIRDGYCADLVLLDDDLAVTRTWVGGHMAIH